MKSALTLTVLACLAHLGWMNPTTVVLPTTQSPAVTPDSQYAKLSKEVMAIGSEVSKVDKTFELNIAFGQTGELHKLLDTIKKIKVQIQAAEVDIRMDIATNTNLIHAYGRRLSVEILRIQVESYDRFLTGIAKDILANVNGFSRGYPTFVNSEEVSITQQLNNAKLQSMVKQINEIDTLIRNNHNQKIDGATKQKIDQDLQKIAQIATQSKSDIASHYYAELERIRTEGKALNLLQQFEIEMEIDMLNYLISYTRHFEELFNRINN